MLRTFDEPDDRRDLGPLARADVVRVGGVELLRITHDPGWRWTEHRAPLAGTARCQALHVGVMLGGTLAVEDGSGLWEACAGDVVVIRPDHDAWTVGDEPAVLLQVGDGPAAAALFDLG